MIDVDKVCITSCFESFVKLYLHSSEQQTNIASVKVFQASFADWYLFIQDRIFNVLRRVVMAFRSGQNYFKSTSNSQTLYQHVITLNIMLKISR